MHVLILDGHPDERRLVSALLDHYAGSLQPGATVQRIAVRDLSFDVNLRRGYGADQDWEADLHDVGAAVTACDHLVVGFPLWWGGEPARLKGLLDRVVLPGFAFRYRKRGPFWDRLLAGRSADVIVTMDTPPWYLRAVYGDPVGRRWRRQVLGFCGFDPVRVFRFGPTRRGEAKQRIEGWQAQVAKAAATAAALKRGTKLDGQSGRSDFGAAVAERRS